ncbi:uncharacterized protein LOC135828959 [Sycon ciliatum]|uniref:uncharacterized protein LOC135828959 n=1 Tax=Sycon ciliatum TaxID=27933 RepID=UPI0031F65E32
MINKSDDVRQLFAVVKELIEDNKTELQQFTAMLFPLECNQSAAVDLSGVWRVLRMHFSRLKPTIAKLLTAVAFSGYVALHLEQRGIGFVKHVVRALEDGMVKFLHEFYGRLEAQEALKRYMHDEISGDPTKETTIGRALGHSALVAACVLYIAMVINGCRW